MTHEQRLLLFKPKKLASLTKSSLYAVAMWGRSLVTAVRFLSKAVSDHNSVAVADYYIDDFWKIHFEESSTTLYASGREHIVRGETYVYMSNHGSWMDIPALFGAVPSSLRMISKAGLMKVPFLGPAMEKAGFIAIDRQNRARAIKQLETAKERLNQGISIWIAPEGTRSRDGKLGPFKKGGFHVARQLGLSIIPVYIEGAHEVMPADSMVVYPNRVITVHFCAPVSTVDVDRAHTDDLIALVRKRIISKQQECEKNS
jgi:1-acyl-sn-glycerol-3-phosphate acyltransferase